MVAGTQMARVKQEESFLAAVGDDDLLGRRAVHGADRGPQLLVAPILSVVQVKAGIHLQVTDVMVLDPALAQIDLERPLRLVEQPLLDRVGADLSIRRLHGRVSSVSKTGWALACMRAVNSGPVAVTSIRTLPGRPMKLPCSDPIIRTSGSIMPLWWT